MNHPYEVIDPAGQTVMVSSEPCRYSRRLELILLEDGYTIKLNGKKLTKTEIRKAVSS